ncbi:hypothetical protein BDY21DRAFT_353885 [Lineolata rhizophorae]|uniref:Secreted protein n=1 Tax=Lineolata rhizophorae TaxID=578093 RepID=A0A6A6NQN1_9PEZI|nr:hypothetical protein BDY21DRAFT_353885 [Lineolata rhizophorae]
MICYCYPAAQLWILILNCCRGDVTCVDLCYTILSLRSRPLPVQAEAWASPYGLQASKPCADCQADDARQCCIIAQLSRRPTSYDLTLRFFVYFDVF